MPTSTASPRHCRLMRHARCAGSTHHCMGWAGRLSSAWSRPADFHRLRLFPNRPSRIRGAQRLAAAVVVDGHWRRLSGDELGVLLGEDALRRGARGTYACSIVSGSLLAAIASAYRQPFVYTLTG